MLTSAPLAAVLMCATNRYIQTTGLTNSNVFAVGIVVSERFTGVSRGDITLVKPKGNGSGTVLCANSIIIPNNTVPRLVPVADDVLTRVL